MVQAYNQAQQDDFGTDEQYEQLEKYLLSLNSVISESLAVTRNEPGEAEISVNKTDSPEEYIYTRGPVLPGLIIGSEIDYDHPEEYVHYKRGPVLLGPFPRPADKPHSQYYNIGLRLYVVLPWPTVGAEHLGNLASFLKKACDLWAKPRNLEIFGSGPDFVAGGAYVIWIGVKQVEVTTTENKA